AVLVQVNTDDNPVTAERDAITSIPAVKAFRNGAVVAEFVGARDAGFVRGWLESSLAPTPAELARAALRADAEAYGGEERARVQHPAHDPHVTRAEAPAGHGTK